MEPLPDSVHTIQVDGWTLRLREPGGPGPYRVILLLHGWTGDENVMWVFAARLPKNALIVSPRGLYPVPEGGFAWEPHRQGTWPAIDDFQPAVTSLVKLIDRLQGGVAGILPGDYRQPSLVGFSQGAALAYSFALYHPERFDRLAGLAGFLPEGAEDLAAQRPLADKVLFVAHGTQDRRVPVERARRAVALLEQAGARVTYCEEDVGHKLGAGCFRGLASYFMTA